MFNPTRLSLRILVIATLLVALPALASATLLENRDSRDYQLKLEQGSGSVTATVKAGKSLAFRCSTFPCKITLSHNDDSITIRSAREDVYISKGQLVRRKKTARR